ncbi:MAG: TonB-dependent receptor [Bacteroidota bacterium]
MPYVSLPYSRIYLTYLVVWFSASFSAAQYRMDTIRVSDTAIRQNLSSQTQVWTAEDLQSRSGQNIAEVLQTEGHIFIKSYGSGSLATSTIRGGSSSHTLVLWNELPLPAPTLGMLDLSLLPTHSSETLRLERGGSAALWGSGAIGGIIALQNTADFSRTLQLQAYSEFGSFGRFQQEVKFGIGNQKIQSITRVAHAQGDNDFYYQVHPNLPSVQQTNARLSQQNIFQDIYWKPQSNQQVNIHFWQQFSYRQIPPTIVQTRSSDYQTDAATRLAVHWQQNLQNSIWKTKIGYFREEQYFYDGRISLNEFTTLLGETTAAWTWGRSGQIMLGATHNYTRANTGGYRVGRQENRTALFATYIWQSDIWKQQFSLRQSLVDGRFIPLIPAWNVIYSPSEQWEWNMKWSRNYRVPTLNDKYWQPFGNPELLPESGWSQEIGGSWQKASWSFSSTIFNRHLNNWIQWSAIAGQSSFGPKNIGKVWSRGIESRVALTSANWTFNAGYDWVRSTYEVALESPRIPKGRQLYYTPQHLAFARLKFQYQNFEAIYHHQYTSTSEGINEDVAPFQLANFSLNYKHLSKRQHEWQIFFRLHNVWNTSYFTVERRAMPGRHFSMGIHWDYQRE